MHVVVVSICHQYIGLRLDLDGIPGTNLESDTPGRLAESAESSKGPTISYNPASEHT